jgi:hypothetical protein
MRRWRWWVFVLALGACGDDAGPEGIVAGGGDASARDAAMEAGPRDAEPPVPFDAETPVEPRDAEAPKPPPPKPDRPPARASASTAATGTS